MNKIFSILIISVLTLTAPFFVFAAGAPSLTNLSANVTGSHNAVLSIFVNPNGNITTLRFKYWTDSNYQERLYMGISGTSSVKIDMGLINLREGTEYSYQVTAENSGGSASSGIGAFSTFGGSSSSGTGSNSSSGSNNQNSNGSAGGSPGAPSLPGTMTNGPASVSGNSAVLNGSVDPNNAQTNFWFEFGPSASLGQSTTLQYVGGNDSWQLVSGTLSGLSAGQTYYYRVVAQNNYGTSRGQTVSFIANSNQQTNGQVLGAVSGSGSSNGNTSSSNGTLNGGSSGSSSTSKTSKTTSTSSGSSATANVKNSRPSFISLEYSLEDKGALVVVAEDLKPMPGEIFSYTVVYKNDSQYSYNEAGLKVIVPVEAEYISADKEPVSITGNTVEFVLDNLSPGSQSAINITVKVRSDVKPGTNLIFTSVLGYKDRFGTQLTTTSYLTVKVSPLSDAPLSASISSMFHGAVVLWVIAIVLVIALALLSRKLINGRKNKKSADREEEDLLGFGGMPPTFQPIDPVEMIKR